MRLCLCRFRYSQPNRLTTVSVDLTWAQLCSVLERIADEDTDKFHHWRKLEDRHARLTNNW